ncbi:hypothetical protein BJM06_01396 [Enterobacter cloacae]|nr:hypothetical protein BJM06_01396 [Enterobacter cloacae]
MSHIKTEGILIYIKVHHLIFRKQLLKKNSLVLW